MENNNRHIFSLANQNGDFSEIELFKNSSSSQWVCTKQQSASSNFILYGIQDVAIITEKKEVTNIISGVYSIIGIAIAKVSNQSSRYYYMIMKPNPVKQFNIFLVRHLWDVTSTLYQKFAMNELIVNLSNSLDWKIPHEFICSHLLPNEETWFGIYGSCGILELVGTKTIRHGKSIQWEYDNLINGTNDLQSKTKRQLQSQKRYTAKKEFQTPFVSHTNSISLLLPETTAKKFLTGREITDESFEKNGNFGIKSKDLGGRTKVIPILSNLTSIDNPTVKQSEMHVVTTIPEAFQIQHTFATLSAAIALLKLQCPKDEEESIMGAVSSKFLECIAWRMVEDSPIQHKLKELKIDIDQVRM